MPKIRRAPNGQLVRFPDEDSEEEIQRFFIKHFPPQDPEMADTSLRQKNIMEGWTKYLEQNRPPEDPQRQMMIEALRKQNEMRKRKQVPEEWKKPPEPRVIVET